VCVCVCVCARARVCVILDLFWTYTLSSWLCYWIQRKHFTVSMQLRLCH